ncbi:MAG: START domain-containing protein [Saprospiraceae bacterium]
MIYHPKTLFALCLIGFCTSFSPIIAQAPPQPWKKIKEIDQYTVYTRSSNLSSVKEIKIEASFDVNVAHFMEVLNNVPAYTDWVYKCSQAHRLKTIGEHEYIYYLISDIPFPLKDRDIVIHSKQWFDPAIQGYRAKSVALPAFISQNPNMVRVPLLQSLWEIRPVNDKQVDIVYQILTEPGGKIPAWMVNMAIANGPIHTMKELALYLKEN